MKQRLWIHPDTAHALDDEFEGTDLDPSWNLQVSGAAASWSATPPTSYTDFASGDPRYNLNDWRRSWLLVQAPNNQVDHFLYKTPASIPTNLLIMAHVRIGAGALAQETMAMGVVIGADDGSGNLDEDNHLYVVSHDDNPGLFGRVIAAANTTIGNTDTTLLITGRGTRVVALHKRGDTYHGFVGSDGKWHYLGSYTNASLAPAHIGLRWYHNSGSEAVTHGCNFFRVLETDQFVV